MTKSIFHITEPGQYQQLSRKAEYLPDSFHDEGFIHCAYQEQVLGVLQRYFQSQNELELLEINTEALGKTLIDENTVGGTELFPHIYGGIPESAIMSVVKIQRGSEGDFSLPF